MTYSPFRNDDGNDSQATKDSAHVGNFGRISLNDFTQTRYSLSLLSPLLLVACGTTASRIATKFTRRIVDSLGELPGCIDFLMIDGAAADDQMDPARHILVDTTGCGTDPNRGLRAFEREWTAIMNRVVRSLTRLESSSRLLPVSYTCRQACNVVQVVGAGGSSGGMAVPCLSLINDALVYQRIQQPRVDVVQLGADMPMRDIDRDPNPEQRCVVPDTCYNNLARICADLQSAEITRDTRPDGSVRIVRRCDQVNSITVMDQTNGSHCLATTEEMIDMVAESLFFRYLTPASRFLADRWRDHDELGCSERGSKQRRSTLHSDQLL